MSLKGKISARCPKGCDEFETEVWSLIRGDADDALRQTVIAGELNLLLCPSCGSPFFAAEPVVYLDARAELLAFVLPESYRERADYWEEKMRADYDVLKGAFGEDVRLEAEPQIFFGFEPLVSLLEDDDFRGEEGEVMECFARELGLGLYRVSPGYARSRRIPPSLPYAGRRRSPGRADIVAGLEKIMASGGSLPLYKAYLKALKKDLRAQVPPAARGPKARGA